MIHKDKSKILWIKNPDFGVFGVMNRTTAIKINVNYEEESNNHNNTNTNTNLILILIYTEVETLKCS